MSAHNERNRWEFDQRAADPNDTEFLLQRRKVDKIAELLRVIAPKARGADIGCHTGSASLSYLDAGIEAIDGFDISEAAMAIARSRGIHAVFWNADGTPCPAVAATYDVVIAGDIIEHLVDTDQFLAEILRIVKPGGWVIVTTPNLASWYSRLRVLRGLAPHGAAAASPTRVRDVFVERNHIRVNVLAEWRHLFEVSGFRVEAVHGCAFWPAVQAGLRASIRGRLAIIFESRPTLADELIFVLQRQRGPLQSTYNNYPV